MEIEIPKSVMAYLMPTLDIIASCLFFYLAVRLTRDFGFGSRRELLLLTHRMMLFIASIAFAYHALDIWKEPNRHGLTFSNFWLHLVLVTLAVVSTIRMTYAENIVYNGGAFGGPFPQRSPPSGAYPDRALKVPPKD